MRSSSWSGFPLQLGACCPSHHKPAESYQKAPLPAPASVFWQTDTLQRTYQRALPSVGRVAVAIVGLRAAGEHSVNERDEGPEAVLVLMKGCVKKGPHCRGDQQRMVSRL